MKKETNKYRYVWSSKHNGCITFQVRKEKVWVDDLAIAVGEYPIHDERAKLAVSRMNERVKALVIDIQVRKLESKLFALKQKASSIREKA